MIAPLAVLIAAALELLVAEPPARAHPVAWLGRVVAPLDREWGRPRLVGAVGALAVPLTAAVAVAVLVVAAGRVSAWLAAAVAGVALFVATSLRMLLSEARSTIAATQTDLDAARRSLRALAGRDAETLSAGQVRSAAVESAAENLADGLVAPLAAFVAGVVVGQTATLSPVPSLALGAGGAAWVKAVNTLDSMLGYRSKPVGWAPARLDDAVMWLPARIGALLLAAAARDPAALLSARPWLDGVPSPNSGWPMGVLAAVHDVRLEKPGVYALDGGEQLPSKEFSLRAVRTVAVAGGLAYALAVATTAAVGGLP
ncbi:cobalamin biosynthesis protein CobD [Halomicrobium sp. IBSBa]|uniref:adenosylcobinamide-phosphate synthase CbiB n=1 Tax=Halomicrobium sp. IBSBa TaxID=2778916 RepID=UPI001ABEEDDF|nr:adenosylcobinamide-phosphate synthase CbiB [Halomicrobium sp. IBSBa]MBO4247166.1 cobalamin biosynthesis protein CobD [Halomicrobium sp. IBSBa]